MNPAIYSHEYTVVFTIDEGTTQDIKSIIGNMSNTKVTAISASPYKNPDCSVRNLCL